MGPGSSGSVVCHVSWRICPLWLFHLLCEEIPGRRPVFTESERELQGHDFLLRCLPVRFWGTFRFYNSSAMSALRGFLPAVCTPRNRMLSVPPVCVGLESCAAGEAIVLSQLAKGFLQTLPCSTLGGKLWLFSVTGLLIRFKH